MLFLATSFIRGQIWASLLWAESMTATTLCLLATFLKFLIRDRNQIPQGVYHIAISKHKTVCICVAPSQSDARSMQRRSVYKLTTCCLKHHYCDYLFNIHAYNSSTTGSKEHLHSHRYKNVVDIWSFGSNGLSCSCATCSCARGHKWLRRTA